MSAERGLALAKALERAVKRGPDAARDAHNDREAAVRERALRRGVDRHLVRKGPLDRRVAGTGQGGAQTMTKYHAHLAYCGIETVYVACVAGHEGRGVEPTQALTAALLRAIGTRRFRAKAKASDAHTATA